MEKLFELKQFVGASNPQCTNLITVASYICFTSDYWQKLLFPITFIPLHIIPLYTIVQHPHYPIIRHFPLSHYSHYAPLYPIVLHPHHPH